MIVLLFADRTLAIDTGRRDRKEQRLTARIAAELQDVPKIAVLLAVQFVKHYAARIDSILRAGVRRNGFIETVRIIPNENSLRTVDDPTLLAELRTVSNHLGGDAEHDGSLFPRSCSTIDFSSLFVVHGSTVQGNAGCEFALTVFFGNLDIGCRILPGPVGFDRSEQLADDLVLPPGKLEFFSGVLSLRVSKPILKKPDCVIGFFGIVFHTTNGSALSAKASSGSEPRSCPGQRATGRTWLQSYSRLARISARLRPRAAGRNSLFRSDTTSRV